MENGMENLSIEATKSSPTIEFNAELNTLRIEGHSYPENAAAFYTPVMDWIAAYVQTAPDAVTFNAHVIYLNTSSTKCFMDIFDILEEAHRENVSVTCNWYYDEENEIARECGEELMEDLSFTFNLIEVSAKIEKEASSSSMG